MPHYPFELTFDTAARCAWSIFGTVSEEQLEDVLDLRVPWHLVQFVESVGGKFEGMVDVSLDESRVVWCFIRSIRRDNIIVENAELTSAVGID